MLREIVEAGRGVARGKSRPAEIAESQSLLLLPYLHHISHWYDVARPCRFRLPDTPIQSQ